MTNPPEIAWFSALCDDDYEFLGVPDPYLKSSWEHCRNIVLRAEEGGFDNILLPSGYELGLDTTAFAAAVAAQVEGLARRRVVERPYRRLATRLRLVSGRACRCAARCPA